MASETIRLRNEMAVLDKQIRETERLIQVDDPEYEAAKLPCGRKQRRVHQRSDVGDDQVGDSKSEQEPFWADRAAMLIHFGLGALISRRQELYRELRAIYRKNAAARRRAAVQRSEPQRFFGGTGSGKRSTVLIPALIDYAGPLLIDPKGELAAVGNGAPTFDPLDVVERTSGRFAEQCRHLAEATVIQDEEMVSRVGDEPKRIAWLIDEAALLGDAFDRVFTESMTKGA